MSKFMSSTGLISWLRLTGRLACLSLLATPVFAQHEINDEAERGPVRIAGNENAFGYSQMAQMAIMQKIQGANRYGWEENIELQNALAAKESVPTNHIIQTDGSGPVLMATAKAYAAPGKHVITCTPGYEQFVEAFKAYGGEVKALPVNAKLQYDLKAIKAAIDENTAVIYICNPNNPTGTVVDPLELAQFILTVPKDVLVFVDEAYLDLAPGGLAKHSMAKLVKQRENMIVARTFSKVWGMAGLRVGYGVAQPAVLEKIKPYAFGGPSILSTVAATAALQDTEFYDYSVTTYTQVRDMVKKRLDELGIEYADPNGSFIFIHTGLPIQELQPRMLEENIEIGRPFAPMFDWARVSIGTEEEMQIFLEVFEKVLKEKGRLS